MAMDFWSTTEHKIKYKAKNKLSIIDSIKMVQYAKIVNKLDEKIIKNKFQIYRVKKRKEDVMNKNYALNSNVTKSFINKRNVRFSSKKKPEIKMHSSIEMKLIIIK